ETYNRGMCQIVSAINVGVRVFQSMAPVECVQMQLRLVLYGPELIPAPRVTSNRELGVICSGVSRKKPARLCRVPGPHLTREALALLLIAGHGDVLVPCVLCTVVLL
ncbi:hypothetical protein LSAT2_018209, partial [Lamellibrachia satsuma]